MLDDPRFQRGVALLASRGLTTGELLDFTRHGDRAGYCMALEALVTRDDGVDASTAILERLTTAALRRNAVSIVVLGSLTVRRDGVRLGRPATADSIAGCRLAQEHAANHEGEQCPAAAGGGGGGEYPREYGRWDSRSRAERPARRSTRDTVEEAAVPADGRTHCARTTAWIAFD